MSSWTSPGTASSSSAATRTARKSGAPADLIISNCSVSPSIAGPVVKARMLTVGLDLVMTRGVVPVRISLVHAYIDRRLPYGEGYLVAWGHFVQVFQRFPRNVIKVGAIDAGPRGGGDSEGSIGIWDIRYGVIHMVTDESGSESSSTHAEGSKNRVTRSNFTEIAGICTVPVPVFHWAETEIK